MTSAHSGLPERRLPLVSTIMIFLNEERFLSEAIESVLAQTCDDWELLLVDDGSTDRSTALARGYAERYPGRIRYLEHESHRNRGMSATRNLGIQAARGRYLAFLDADDVWLPEKLEQQAAILDTCPRVAAVCGRAQWWYTWTGAPSDSGRDFLQRFSVPLDSTVEPPTLLLNFLRDEWASLCDLMVRRQAVDAVGGYEESFHGMYEDQAFHAKLCVSQPVFVSSQCWYRYRQHPEAATAQSHKAGAYRFARRKFLTWLQRYLGAQGGAAPEVERMVDGELWSLRPRVLGKIAHWFRRRTEPIRRWLQGPRAPGVAKLKRASRWVAKRLTDRAVVLMYHQVAEKDPDPWSLAVSPANFAEQLEVLRRHARPVSLSQLAEGQRAGAVPARGVAVTFDDGYANNLHQAKPVLEQFDVAATVFVASGYVDWPREYWWEELDQLLLGRGRLPAKLQLRMGTSTQEWDTGLAPRVALYFSVWQQLQPLGSAERQQALQAIWDWAGGTASPRAAHRPMTAAELQQLEQGGLIDIGAHTVNHPLLTAHSRATQRQEIREGKAYLEEVLGHSVRAFSYPFGAYHQETVELVREAGFECAVSTVAETVWSRSNPLQLPRFTVPNCGGEEFERLLLGWLRQ